MNIIGKLFGLRPKTEESNTELATAGCISSRVVTGRAPSPGRRVVLRTKEGNRLFIGKADIEHLATLKQMLNDLAVTDGGGAELDIPISLSEKTLKMILVWCRSKPALPASELFSNHSVPELMIAIDACLFLNMDHLAGLLGSVVASNLKGKKSNEMRTILQRENKQNLDEAHTEMLKQLYMSEDVVKVVVAVQPLRGPLAGHHHELIQ